ncbi:MAG: hypothetical protein IPK82_43730 [Polyangiaceae bacterium]|nr:hypothetical protein [Polyangiaceae bacterium]
MRAGLPENGVSWAALAVGVALVFAGPHLLERARGREKRVVLGLGLLAALLSWGYIHVYLRGGPRIIDATSYFLEARALSKGIVAWPTGEPETSVLGRFLVQSESMGETRAAVLFPPGYPAVLAVGFLLGAPLAVGPVIAFGLVVATFTLAREVVRDDKRFADVPLIAAVLSTVCGALRYHTADTMSHGLAALLFALALIFAFRSRVHTIAAVGAGAFTGFLFATRPASGFACAATVAAVIVYTWPKNVGLANAARYGVGNALRAIGAALLGALPFVAAYWVFQRLATGVWFVTSHTAAYALNDGPPGCFRYGFGEGVGCWGEHGDFVRANLPNGFGAFAATKTTLRRLWMHLVDAGNVEPIALLVPAGLACAKHLRTVRCVALAITFQVAFYVPFYFDGNYPGGGARFFVDVLPAEHVLVAVACVHTAQSSRVPMWLRERSSLVVAAIALIGFALRGGHDHASLRDRDGGAPLFSSSALNDARVTRGVLFVQSDAAFNLAAGPGTNADRGIEVLRKKGDGLDALALELRGFPPSFEAHFQAGQPGRTVILPFAPTAGDIIEGENLWPPIEQRGGAFALPVYTGGSCASGDRALQIFSTQPQKGDVRVRIPKVWARGKRLQLVVFSAPGKNARAFDGALTISLWEDGQKKGVVTLDAAQIRDTTCSSVLEAAISETAQHTEISFSADEKATGWGENGPVFALDRIQRLSLP